MSARVESEARYFGYCPECPAGYDPDEPGDDEAVKAWADQHNAENHEAAA